VIYWHYNHGVESCLLCWSVRRQLGRSTLFPYTTLFRSVLRALSSCAWHLMYSFCRPKQSLPAAGKSSAPAAQTSAIRPIPSGSRSEEHTSELQSREKLVCRLRLEKKKMGKTYNNRIEIV